MNQDLLSTFYSFAPVIGMILAVFIGFIFWKRTSNKSSNEIRDKIKDEKKDIGKKIEVNTKKQDEIFEEVNTLEKEEKKHEEKIDEVISDTAKEIQDLTKVKDPRETIKRIRKNWN